MTQPPRKASSWTDSIRVTDGVIGRVSVLYEGPEKSFKTTYGLTWPDPFVFAFDANTATLMNQIGTRWYAPTTWREFATECVPTILNRKLAAGTIVVDTVSSACRLCEFEIAKDVGKHESGEFDRPEYRRLLMKTHNVFAQLCDAKKPRSDHPGYHIVLLSHEREWYKQKKVRIGAGEARTDLVLDRVRPAIEGDFKNILPTLVDSVFGTRVRLNEKTKTPQPYILTVPPDEYYFYGDGVGNAPGREPLPAEMPGDFASLAKAWGLKL